MLKLSNYFYDDKGLRSVNCPPWDFDRSLYSVDELAGLVLREPEWHLHSAVIPVKGTEVRAQAKSNDAHTWILAFAAMTDSRILA